MKRATNLGLVMGLCVFLSIFFLAQSSSAIDLDKKKKLTLDELIAGAKKEGNLVFYTSWPNFTIKAVVKKFKEAYPFLKVQHLRAGGLTTAQRFYAEKDKKVEKVDAIDTGAMEFFADWRRKGFLARLDNLPEWENVHELAKGVDGRYVAGIYGTHAMAWNRNVYKDEEIPDDLWEFTKPKWKNKVASGDPATAGFALNWYSFISDIRPQDPRSKKKPTGLGLKWMEAMRENGILLAGQVGSSIETLVSGRRPVLVHHKEDEIADANKRGANLGSKYAIQGTFAHFSYWAVNIKAPHPYAGRLFLNYLLSKELQTFLVKEQAYNTIRNDIKTSDFIKGRIPLSECWIMGIEQITPVESREFMRKINVALRGKGKAD